MYKAFYNRRKGQTLLEVLLALSVITMGLLGVLTLLSKSFFYGRVVTDEVTATYLASEGVEVAKNLIDHDVHSGAAWGTCFGGPGTSVQVALDYQSIDCSSIQHYTPGMVLRFDPATNKYGYANTAGSVTTGFSRDVSITVANDAITVRSIVDWNTGPVTSQSIDVEDQFYNQPIL